MPQMTMHIKCRLAYLKETWKTSYMEVHIPAIATPIFLCVSFYIVLPSSLDFSYLGYHIKQLLSRSSLKVFHITLSSFKSPESLSLLFISRTPKYQQYEGLHYPLCSDVRCVRGGYAYQGRH